MPVGCLPALAANGAPPPSSPSPRGLDAAHSRLRPFTTGGVPEGSGDVGLVHRTDTSRPFPLAAVPPSGWVSNTAPQTPALHGPFRHATSLVVLGDRGRCCPLPCSLIAGGSRAPVASALCSGRRHVHRKGSVHGPGPGADSQLLAQWAREGEPTTGARAGHHIHIVPVGRHRRRWPRPMTSISGHLTTRPRRCSPARCVAGREGRSVGRAQA